MSILQSDVDQYDESMYFDVFMTIINDIEGGGVNVDNDTLLLMKKAWYCLLCRQRVFLAVNSVLISACFWKNTG